MIKLVRIVDFVSTLKAHFKCGRGGGREHPSGRNSDARNEIMDFHSRKLVFLDGPEGVTVELSQRY